jgi:hypothetical protein
MSLEDLSFEQRDELAALAKQLADNPETRENFLRLTKQVKPDLTIPELALKDDLSRQLKASQDDYQKLAAKIREKEQMENLQSLRNQLIKKGKASEDDIPEIEKLMLEKQINDHETAADYFRWMKQAATPTSDASMGYNPNVMKKFNLESFMKNPIQGARNEAAAALADLQKNRRPIGI